MNGAVWNGPAWWRGRVALAGRVVPFTVIEFDLLRVLSLNAGQVVSTAVLLRQVWGTLQADIDGRVRTADKRLRRKLGEDADKIRLPLRRARRRQPHRRGRTKCRLFRFRRVGRT